MQTTTFPGTSDRSGLWQMSAAMTLSGTIGVFVLQSGQSAWNVVFFRCLFGALGLALYGWRRGLFRQSIALSPRQWLLALLSGAALVLNWVLLFSSYRLASISLSTAIYNVQPFLLIGLGALVLRERVSRSALAFTLLAFSGLLLILRWQGTPPQGYLLGLSMALGAAASYSVTALIVKQLRQIPPLLLALIQTALGVILLLPLADFQALPVQPQQWFYLVALGLMHTCLMYVLMYSAIQSLPTTSVAALSFIYPAVAILLDLAVYGRALSVNQWAGIALIFVAVAGVSLRRR